MCVTITVSESTRRLMGLSTTVINTVLVFLGLTLLVAALGFRFKLDNRIELLSGYDSGTLSVFLMFTALLMFACHLAAMKFCHSATYAETRSEKHHLFVAMIIVLMGLFLFLVIAMIVVLVHGSKIRSAFTTGITEAIKSYRNDLDTKEMMDNLQLEIECCGVKSYKDWFEISWISLVFVNVDHEEVKSHVKDGDFIKDDTPFSCCSKHSKRACIHHSVKNVQTHNNHADTTLHTSGCVDKIMTHFNDLLIIPTTILLVVILVLEGIVIAVMRLLQTSILTAEEMNDPEGPSMAYCIKGLGGGMDNRDYFKRKRPKDDVTEDDDDGDDDKEEKGRKAKKKRALASRDEDENDSDDDEVDDEGGSTKSRSGGHRAGGGGGDGSRADDKDGNRGEKKKRNKEREEKKKKGDRHKKGTQNDEKGKKGKGKDDKKQKKKAEKKGKEKKKSKKEKPKAKAKQAKRPKAKKPKQAKKKKGGGGKKGRKK